jgi:hypothetical protein
MIDRRNFTTLLLAGAALAACSSPPPRTRFPELTYGHLGLFTLDVERIEIVSEYKANFGTPNVEHLFPTPPEQTLRRWAQDRLAATGKPGRYGRFVIQDAKVTETPLPRTPGLRGAFTTDQTHRYDGTLSAVLEIREERGNLRAGTASAWANRARTVAEGITINDREKVWFDLLESMMNDLNAEMDRQIRANLTQFLVLR